MKTLISMTDFVIQQRSELMFKELGKACCKYANFLKQPLKLEMFVACNENGDVLEEPKNDFRGYDDYSKRLNVFEKAKEKVLFEGFYWEGNYAVCMAEDEMIYIDDEFMQNMTIDKFLTTIITDLQLTPTALKQIF